MSRLLLLALASCLPLLAQAAQPLLPPDGGYDTPDAWRQPVAPFRIAERSWYVGTAGLTALLVDTPDGAVLIDGGLPQAAELLLNNLRSVGVAPQRLRYILHSHAHADHVGPLAAVRRATGARLLSNAESAALLARGGSDDIHFGDDLVYPPVTVDRLLQDGETVELGGMRFTAHFTPAHTPGSLSWTWEDRLDGRPLRIAYVDSLSAPGYRLLDNPHYPRILDDYRRGFAAIRGLACDLLITPHPDASGWDPAAARRPQQGAGACRDYADRAAQKLEAQRAQQAAAR